MTLQDLIDYVVNYMKRSDLAGVMPQFIAIAEAKINSQLRTEAQVIQFGLDTGIQAPVSVGVWALPDDFLEIRGVSYYWGQSVIPLESVGRDKLAGYVGSGAPVFYSIWENNIEVAPAPAGQVLTITYFAGVKPLLGVGDTNPVLAKYPQIYLGLVLAEAHRSVQDYEASAGESGMVEREIRQVNAAASASRVGSAPSMGNPYNYGLSRSNFN